MRNSIDTEKEAYNEANIRLAEAYHRMSEIYEEWAGKGFESTKMSGLELALGWERLSVENRKRYADVPESINAGENNIRRIKEKIRKCKGRKSGDNKPRNT